MSVADMSGVEPLRIGLPGYQAAHFRTMPVKERDKRPLFEGWPELATDDPNVHAQWIEQYPRANIGMVLGFQPYNGHTYFVLDLDVSGDGQDGAESLMTYMAARQHTLPHSLRQATGGGGMQIFYYCSGDMRVPNKVGLLEGVDVRGDGGQVVIPPSVHPTGRQYQWIDPTVPIAEAPPWLLELVGAEPRNAPSNRNVGPSVDTAAQGDPIPEHSRNQELFKIACALRNRGVTKNGILGQLYDINANRCQPPLDNDELEEIAESASKYDPDQPLPHWPSLEVHDTDSVVDYTSIDAELDTTDARSTDRYNGLEFARVHAGKLIWTEALGWLVWNGQRWEVDDLEHHARLMSDLVHRLRAQVLSATDHDQEILVKRILRLESTSGVANAVRYIRPYMGRKVREFDVDPYVVNFQNCTLDLRTGGTRPHDPTDLITRICTVEYDEDAVDPIWEQFILDALPDPQMRLTFQRFMGSCLTGICRDKAILLPFGPSNTGKTTAVEPCANVLGRASEGGYTAVWDASVVAHRGGGNVDEKVNQVRGARLVVVGELERGSSFNEGFVKRFSGGDTVSARALYKASYEFRPEAKLVMHTNYVPRSKDRALQNRLKLLPFQHVFENRDERIKVHLETDPGAQRAIAAWMVRGCVDWMQAGLGEMPWLEEHMHAYQRDSEPMLAYIEDCLVETQHPSEYVTLDQAYRSYQAYCMTSNEKAMSRRAFERAMQENGYPKEAGRFPLRFSGSAGSDQGI